MRIYAINRSVGLRGASVKMAAHTGSRFRWTIEQLGGEAAARVRDVNLARIGRDKVEAIETNALFARARRPG